MIIDIQAFMAISLISIVQLVQIYEHLLPFRLQIKIQYFYLLLDKFIVLSDFYYVNFFFNH